MRVGEDSRRETVGQTMQIRPARGVRQAPLADLRDGLEHDALVALLIPRARESKSALLSAMAPRLWVDYP